MSSTLKALNLELARAGMTRNQLVLKVLHDYVDVECSVHSVLGEAARRNPIVAEKIGRNRG